MFELRLSDSKAHPPTYQMMLSHPLTSFNQNASGPSNQINCDLVLRNVALTKKLYRETMKRKNEEGEEKMTDRYIDKIAGEL